VIDPGLDIGISAVLASVIFGLLKLLERKRPSNGNGNSNGRLSTMSVEEWKAHMRELLREANEDIAANFFMLLAAPTEKIREVFRQELERRH